MAFLSREYSPRSAIVLGLTRIQTPKEVFPAPTLEYRTDELFGVFEICRKHNLVVSMEGDEDINWETIQGEIDDALSRSNLSPKQLPGNNRRANEHTPYPESPYVLCEAALSKKRKGGGGPGTYNLRAADGIYEYEINMEFIKKEGLKHPSDGSKRLLIFGTRGP